MKKWAKRIVIILLILAVGIIAASSMRQTHLARKEIRERVEREQELMRENGLLESEVASERTMRRVQTERIQTLQDRLGQPPDAVVKWKTNRVEVPVEITRWRDKICPSPTVPPVLDDDGIASSRMPKDGGGTLSVGASSVPPPGPLFAIQNDITLSAHRVGGSLFAAGDIKSTLYIDDEPVDVPTQHFEHDGSLRISQQFSDCLASCDFPRGPYRNAISLFAGENLIGASYTRPFGTKNKWTRRFTWSAYLISLRATGEVTSGSVVLHEITARDTRAAAGIGFRWGD